MLKRILTTFAVIAATGALAFAQTKTPAPNPDAQGQMVTQEIAAAPTGKAVNIRVEVAINDQTGAAAPGQKTVTMIVADGHTGKRAQHGSRAIRR